MIGIIDYGMGNLLSVFHAFEMIGEDVEICSDPTQLDSYTRLVLPGVGAFKDCIGNLNSSGFSVALNAVVLGQCKPILGICLGMQVMAGTGFEHGECEGLGWLDAEVIRLEPKDTTLRVPHVGWNDVAFKQPNQLSEGIPHQADFYFVHSYHIRCFEKRDINGTCDYGGTVTAAVCHDNILGTQFHPEKSQDHGLRFLSNFANWYP